VFLKAAGLRQVYFLRGGLGDWMDEVLNPTISPEASAQQKQAFEATAELSRYFGGQPRIGERTKPAKAADDEPEVAAMVERARRRGC
jgi:3-mercaptopyruvate sulfurtransferase SseA